LAVLAWLKVDVKTFHENIENGIQFLHNHKCGRAWDSTQSNTLCLMAILAHQRVAVTNVQSEQGAISLVVNDKVNHSESLPLGVGSRPSPISFPDISESVTVGENVIGISLENFNIGGTLSVELTYATLKPNNHPDCRVKLEAAFAGTAPGSILNITEGEGTEVVVRVTNVTDQPLPMVIAQIRLPGGIEPRFTKLQELVKSGKVDYYEIFGGREVVLYWRGMDEKGVVELSFDVVALVPGTYTGRASTVYLYYTPEEAFYVNSLKADIKRAEKQQIPYSSAPEEPIPTQPESDLVTEHTQDMSGVIPTTNDSNNDNGYGTSSTMGDYDYGKSSSTGGDIDISMFGGGSGFGGFIGFN